MKYSISLSLLVAGSYAQSLTSVLASAKGINDIKDVLQGFPQIVSTLAAAKDITIFLPKDGAKGLAVLNGAAAARPAKNAIEAALTYHVVKGVFPAAAVPANAFVETLLSAGSFSQVSGGQKLQVQKSAKGVQVIGGGPAANVVTADIKFDGGIIHLIDAVLQPPASVVTVAPLAGLTSLVAALAKANLAKTIEAAKDVTIFAPTNAAFTAATPLLAKLSAEQVSSALTYHVVPSVAFSNQLKDGQVLPTLQGGSLKVSIAGGVVSINGAKVAKADVLVKQGVVHVIDQVLVPSGAAPSAAQAPKAAAPKAAAPKAPAPGGHSHGR